MMHYTNYGMIGYGWIFQLLILLVFFLVVWWVLRSSQTGSKESPRDILKRRLAEGEITQKEYQELKKELNNGS